MIGRRLLFRAIPVVSVLGMLLAGTVGNAGAAVASTSHSVASTSGTPTLPDRHPGKPTSLAAAKAYLAAHPPTAAQLAAAKAYLAAHPLHLQATYTKAAMSHGSAAKGVSPQVSVSISWDHLDVNLTPTDTENIWNLIFATGLATAGVLLCAESAPLAIACAAVGAVIGYVVADAVYNYFDWGACGLTIRFWFSGGPATPQYTSCH